MCVKIWKEKSLTVIVPLEIGNEGMDSLCILSNFFSIIEIFNFLSHKYYVMLCFLEICNELENFHLKGWTVRYLGFENDLSYIISYPSSL